LSSAATGSSQIPFRRSATAKAAPSRAAPVAASVAPPQAHRVRAPRPAQQVDIADEAGTNAVAGVS